MLKLMGAVLIFGACASLGLSARQGLRQRVSSADAMLLALALIEGEIASRRTPVPEIVGQLSESDNAAIRTVFGALHRRLLMRDGLSLVPSPGHGRGSFLRGPEISLDKSHLVV